MRFRPLSRGAVAGVSAVAVLGVGGAVLAATQLGSSGTAGGLLSGGSDAPAATPVVRVVGLRHGHIPWDRPAALRARHGTFDTITVMRRDGTAVEGRLSGDGETWISRGRLVPLTHYVA